MDKTNEMRPPALIKSLCIDTQAYYQRRAFPGGFANLLRGGDGTALSPAEAATFFVVEKARGHAVIPVSAQCGKPCEHADRGCKGFDYSGNGCPGYFVGGD